MCNCYYYYYYYYYYYCHYYFEHVNAKHQMKTRLMSIYESGRWMHVELSDPNFSNWPRVGCCLHNTLAGMNTEQ